MFVWIAFGLEFRGQHGQQGWYWITHSSVYRVTASVKASTRHHGWHVGVGVWVRPDDPDGISRDVNESVYIRC